jgi:hypothetical protein
VWNSKDPGIIRSNIMNKSEEKVLEASVLLERARVLSAILTRQYFGQDVATPADLWKISGYFFDDAKVVAETITDMVKMRGNC